MLRLPPRRILVPLDTTPESAVAWRQALALSRLFGSSLEVLHVQPWQPAAAETMAADFVWTTQASEAALRWIHDLAGPEVPVHRTEGHPGEQIVRFALRGGFDLIVLGTHGRRGLALALAGSTAEYVARRSEVPSLVVRRPRESFRSILAPVNFGPRSEGALRAAATLADRLGARVALLSVIEPPLPATPQAVQALRERQRSAILALPPRLKRRCAPLGRVAFGHRVAEIAKEAERHDLVVIVSRIRRPFADRVVGTTAERVLRACPVPVLVLPPEPAGAAAEELAAPISLP